MLKLSGTLAIRRTDRPAIRAHARLSASRVNHRFDRKNHARLELYARTPLTVVKDIWLFVQRTANSVPGIFSHRRKALRLTILLNHCSNIAQVLARTRLLNAKLHAALRYIQQALRLFVYAANRERNTRIPNPAIVVYADVDTNDIAI